MFARVTPLADRPGFSIKDGGVELRVRTDEGRLFCFLGQALGPGGVGTGASVERIVLWRDLTPLTFVSVQGDIGWMITLSSPDFPTTRKMGEDRAGWNTDEMLMFAFTEEARARYLKDGRDLPLFRWDLENPLDPQHSALGGTLF
jgi:hypothetical protein